MKYFFLVLLLVGMSGCSSNSANNNAQASEQIYEQEIAQASKREFDVTWMKPETDAEWQIWNSLMNTRLKGGIYYNEWECTDGTTGGDNLVREYFCANGMQLGIELICLNMYLEHPEDFLPKTVEDFWR